MNRLAVWLLFAAFIGVALYAPPAARPTSAGQPALYTNAQAAAGAKEFAAKCSVCHGAHLEGVSAPALRGAASGLAGDSVATAYTFISTQMPAGAPGSLSPKEYTDILGYILKMNGHPAGPVPLTPAGAKKISTNV